MVFVRNDRGNYDFELYLPEVEKRRATRLHDIDLKKVNTSSLTGSYTNSETGVSIQINHESENMFEVIVNGESFSGELLRNDWLQARNYEFHFETSGEKVDQMYLDYGSLRNVRFTRDLKIN